MEKKLEELSGLTATFVSVLSEKRRNTVLPGDLVRALAINLATAGARAEEVD